MEMLLGTVDGNRLDGVRVENGAFARMDGVRASGNNQGRFVCSGRLSRLELRNCQSGGPKPFCSLYSGILELHNCTISTVPRLALSIDVVAAVWSHKLGSQPRTVS